MCILTLKGFCPISFQIKSDLFHSNPNFCASNLSNTPNLLYHPTARDGLKKYIALVFGFYGQSTKSSTGNAILNTAHAKSIFVSDYPAHLLHLHQIWSNYKYDISLMHENISYQQGWKIFCTNWILVNRILCVHTVWNRKSFGLANIQFRATNFPTFVDDVFSTVCDLARVVAWLWYECSIWPG